MVVFMKTVSVFDAKTHFSGIVEKVYSKHESIIITRRGVKIAKIVPFEAQETNKREDIIRELQALSDEVGRVGVRLEDIKKMKEEGRK